MLLGLNGIVVKSHGGTDDFGFASAIEVAADLVSNEFLDMIATDFDLLDGNEASANKAAVS